MESSLRCWTAGRQLAEKECFCQRHQHDRLSCSCRCALIGVPCCLGMLSIFSTFDNILKLTISPQAKRAETDPRQGTPMRAHLQPPEFWSLLGKRPSKRDQAVDGRSGDAKHGKGQMGSARMGSLQMSCFVDRGICWVFLFTYFYLPKSARAYEYLFPQSVKIVTFAAAPLVLTPFVRNQETLNQTQGHAQKEAVLTDRKQLSSKQIPDARTCSKISHV